MNKKKGLHGLNEETFETLSFSGQAKSINGDLRVVEMAIRAHLRKAENENRDMAKIRSNCIGQLERLIRRL